MKTFILFSVSGETIRHLQVHKTLSDAEKALYDAATNHVIDRIGKNNYVDTINNEVPVKLCPAGYVVKYARGESNADVDVPKKSAEYINQIYIMNTHDVETGRIFSCKVRKVNIEIYYAISEVNSSDAVAGVLPSNAPPMRLFSRNSSEGPLRAKYNEVIKEILMRTKCGKAESADTIVLKSDLTIKEETQAEVEPANL